MLQTAVTVLQHLNHKLIAVACRRWRVHQAACGMTNRCDVLRQGRGPAAWGSADQKKLMAMAIDVKSLDVEGTGMNRTIDQSIEILGDPSVINNGERNVDSPGLRNPRREAMLMPTTAFDVHGNSGQAQGGEIRIKVTGTDREIACLDGVVEPQFVPSRHLNLPARWANPPGGDGFISAMDHKTVEVLSVIPDGVGARRPDR